MFETGNSESAPRRRPFANQHDHRILRQPSAGGDGSKAPQRGGPRRCQRSADLGAANVQLVLGSGEGRPEAEPDGIWSALENFLFPDEDREVYAKGLRRGGYLVTVTSVDDASYEAARDILDDDGTIDLDERADLWRREGWSGWQHGTSPDVMATGYTEGAFAAPPGDSSRPTVTRDHARSSGTVRTYWMEASRDPGGRAGEQTQEGADQSQQFGTDWSQNQRR